MEKEIIIVIDEVLKNIEFCSKTILLNQIKKYLFDKNHITNLKFSQKGFYILFTFYIKKYVKVRKYFENILLSN